MRRLSGLAAKEARLAMGMLAPAFVIVAAVVIFPVLINFWISFKPVRLGDLRTPVPTVRSQVARGAVGPGETLVIRYLLRNSSRDVPIREVVLTARVPEGTEPESLPPGCAMAGETSVRCELGAWPGGYSGRLEIAFRAGAEFSAERLDRRNPTRPEISGTAPNVLTDATFTLRNYRAVLGRREFGPALLATAAYTLFGSLGSITLGLLAAQLLRRRFFGKGLLRGLFLFPYVAPIIAVAFTWVFLLDPLSGTVNGLLLQYGVVGRPISFLSVASFTVALAGVRAELPLALSTVIAFDAWRYFPFSFLFILARLQAIPEQLYESAEVDGAGAFRKFWSITLPQLATVLTTLFLLRFMWTFNKFDDVFLLTGGAAGTRTLPIQVYDNAFGRADIGAGAATAVLLFGFLAVFMVFYFRFSPETEE